MKTAGGHISCEAALWGAFGHDHVVSGHCQISTGIRNLYRAPVVKHVKWGNPEFSKVMAL